MKLLSTRALITFVLLLAAVRLASIGLYPLGDTTEARYGEVARLMAASGDWITPYNDPGIPFWAKPPLSFWAQAASMKLLGVTEFAARISSVLLAGAVVWLLFTLARQGDKGRAPAEAWLASVILCTTPLFFLMSGAVMTDMALLAAMMLSMTGFWLAWRPHASAWPRAWGYAFFAGLGLSLLAKGPVGLALTAAAIGLFWLLEGERLANLARLWSRLPWVGGMLLMLAIAAPWYLAAERKTPGFIEYFIVGEHFKRFLVPGWQGDMFGNAHLEPRGKIWVFMAQAVGPWLLALLWALWEAWQGRHAAAPARSWSALDRYLLAWTLATPIFFSAAGNTIWSYVLPTLPALALLLARRLRLETAVVRRGVPLIAALMLALASVLYLVVLPSETMQVRRSTLPLLQAKMQRAADPGAPLYVVGTLRHSTKFYSRATAIAIKRAQLPQVLEQPGELFVVVEARAAAEVPAELMQQGRLVGLFDGLALVQRPAAGAQ